MSSNTGKYAALHRRRVATALWTALAILSTLSLTPDIQAHPSVSVVVDSSGTIYYSDLSRVWMITPDGARHIAVNHVHTHELWIGPEGHVWGDDVQNVGEQYRHRVWKRLRDGTLINELPWRDGHPTEFNDFSFDRDGLGNMYVLRRDNVTIEVRDTHINGSGKRASGGRVTRTIPLDRSLGFPHWLTVTSDGTVFVTVGSTLLRVRPGSTEAEPVASELVERSAAFADLHDRHAIMALWTLPRKSDATSSPRSEATVVFVSDFAGQTVRRVDVTADPRVQAPAEATVAWESKDNWSVTGGTVLDDGTMLLLEWSNRNEVRVQRVRPDGTAEVVG